MISAYHVIAGAGLVALGACSSEPQYIQSREFIEVGIPDSDITAATTQVILPLRLEDECESMERAELSAELGIDVPYVGLDDVSVSIEWTIRNVSDTEGTARVHVNGGNEWFSYVPANFVIDPDEDEEPPPLAGDIPIQVPAQGTVHGVFREDQLREAAIDLELITRGAQNPFAAIFQVHEDTAEFVDMTTGAAVPARAFAHMVQYDITLEANRHMILELAIRVRDHRGLLHELLLLAPDEERTQFTPVEFAPPAPMP